jgi:hypothetical protein
VRISRRQLIGWGVAVSVPSIVAPIANAFAITNPHPPRVALVVLDRRFGLARRVALSVALPAVRRLALPRDVLDLWHRELEPLCRTGTQAIAGVTTERGLFLLQTLAADHRMHLLSRSTHRAHPGSDHEPLVSWLLGPRTMRA